MSHKRTVAISVALGLAIILAGTIFFLWDRICGNYYPIRFYGRIVDVNGNGMPRVAVTFKLFYSDRPALPVMYGRVERKRLSTVYTDASGNFELGPQSGYGLSVAEISVNGQHPPFAGRPPYPAMSFYYTERGSVTPPPDSPSKRINYKLQWP